MKALKESPGQIRSFQRLTLPAQPSARAKLPLSRNAAQPPDVQTERSGKIKNILVPTDFSACSAEAVARAAELARQHDATLTILHVIDINPPTAPTHCGTAVELMERLWTTGISALRRLTESLAQNHTKARRRILEGLPAEAIVENSSGFDLLVIGQPRSRSSWKFFSRHTARRVIERAECPVLVVDESRRGVDRTPAYTETVALR
jgi:nucleotide-binding universal stress UspA family protein